MSIASKIQLGEAIEGKREVLSIFGIICQILKAQLRLNTNE
jgi:hypothetical protein